MEDFTDMNRFQEIMKNWAKATGLATVAVDAGGISSCESLVKQIEGNVSQLNSIQQKQKILALNASIEAARAGEAGRGFTIVANEVENLSKDSSALNNEISNTVKKIAEVIQDLLDAQVIK